MLEREIALSPPRCFAPPSASPAPPRRPLPGAAGATSADGCSRPPSPSLPRGSCVTAARAHSPRVQAERATAARRAWIDCHRAPAHSPSPPPFSAAAACAAPALDAPPALVSLPAPAPLSFLAAAAWALPGRLASASAFISSAAGSIAVLGPRPKWPVLAAAAVRPRGRTSDPESSLLPITQAARSRRAGTAATHHHFGGHDAGSVGAKYDWTPPIKTLIGTCLITVGDKASVRACVPIMMSPPVIMTVGGEKPRAEAEPERPGVRRADVTDSEWEGSMRSAAANGHGGQVPVSSESISSVRSESISQSIGQVVNQSVN